MDSLTQLTLGAAVGEAALGHKIGRKAMMWGAVCGTLPDLDILIPFADPIRDFTYHRSFSHSIFFLTLMTPLIVWLILKIHPDSKHLKRRWIWLVWLVFISHILLDCFTVYGTQIFWPIWNYPVGWASVFIIDPLYTIPLILGVLAALVLKRSKSVGHRLNYAGLMFSSMYLVWSLLAQHHATTQVRNFLSQQSILYQNLLISAAPLTTFLWRVVVVESDQYYYEGFYSILNGSNHMTLNRYENRPDLLSKLDSSWSVERLKWFTKGYYKVWHHPQGIIISDIRMGLEPEYVFSFVIAKPTAEGRLALANDRIRPNRNPEMLKKVWQLIWFTPTH